MLISKFNNNNIDLHIESFENKYSFKFPEQYKKFLLKYNGGQTPKSKFRINRVSSDIRGFYGFGEVEEHYNFSSIEKNHAFNEFLEDSVLPIASNSFGDFILLGIGKENDGKIYYYYHDRQKKYIELAEDFKTFTDKCKSEKIGHIMSIEERKEMLIKNGNEQNITPGWIQVWQEEIDRFNNIHQEKLILE